MLRTMLYAPCLLAMAVLVGCVATQLQPQPPALELLVDGLQRPLGLVSADDGSGRLFVLEQGGTIRMVENGQIAETPYLDIRDRVSTGGERGLLGAAFASDFETTGRFYVVYTDLEGNSILSRFTTDPDENAVDVAAEQVLLAQPQPYGNHNGGHIAFGPDGYLYVGLGDGGGSGDPLGTGQDLSTWLGKLLRIDVSGAETYLVPEDNPFVGTDEGLPEIWASGLRNPWRFSFDRETGDLWIGDVGQNRYEEIDFEPAASAGGVNYGWSVMEGPVCFQATTCDQAGLQLPVLSYSHDSGWGASVTGGFVYRGNALPDLQGAYLFGDFLSGSIFVARPTDAGAWAAEEMMTTNLSIASFGEDEAGELYVVDLVGGAVYRLVAD